MLDEVMPGLTGVSRTKSCEAFAIICQVLPALVSLRSDQPEDQYGSGREDSPRTSSTARWLPSLGGSDCALGYACGVKAMDTGHFGRHETPSAN